MSDIEVNGAIKHSDLTNQQVMDVERRVKMDEPDEKPDFEEYFDSKTWKSGVTGNLFRVLVHLPIKPGDVKNFLLQEDIAPVGRKLKYMNFSENTKDYGTKYVYTWKDILYNADSIVADISSELRQWTRELKTFIYGAALLSTNSSMANAAGTRGLLTSFRKAQTIFTKLKTKPWANGEWDAVMPIEVADVLTEEYRAAYTHDLTTTEMKEVKAGYVGSYKKFSIVVPQNDGATVLTHLTSEGAIDGFYVLFIGKTQVGRKPGVRYGKGAGSIDVIHNPLGSGVVKDADGNLTSDDNKQKGSVAENINFFSAHVEDDRAVMKMFVPLAYITAADGFNEATDMANVKKDVVEVINTKTTANGHPKDPTNSQSPRD